MFTSRGWGFRRLAEAHVGNVAGDTLVAMSLAGSLFFAVPSAEARGNVALYLLITLTPFAILGPFLAGVYERFPTAYRGGLMTSAAMRTLLALLMIPQLDSFLLFPVALLVLVFSRFHGISRSSVLPSVLESRGDLISANAQLARIGVLGGALAVPLGTLGIWLVGPWVALVLASVVFLWSARSAHALPVLGADEEVAPQRTRRSRRTLPRAVRLARFATAAVRFLNGFLLLLVVFAFRDVDAGALDFGALLAAGGLGFYLAALVTPILERRISEEPMVVAGLAVEAGAAFVAAQVFGLPAAAFLALAAGFAWGTAKFGFDGLLQATVAPHARGRAFTGSETFFQSAWVLGALIPLVPGWPIEFGLIVAGLTALVIQVVYVSAVLVPVVAHRRGDSAAGADRPRSDVMDVLG